jgi:hypothetical protein
MSDTEQVVQSQETAPQQQVETQVNETKEQTFSQDDLNRIVAERIAREKAKFDKKFENVDIDHYKTLVEQEEQRKHQELEKRGEYEKLLKEQAEKFNSKIQTYESELHSIKVDGTLLNEASTAKAINPQQVSQLLKGKLRLNEAGAVDVVDDNGNVRYNENGDPLKVSDLVNEFLTANPHFKAPTPRGSGSGSGVGEQKDLVETDISKLDMNNPKHREKYAEAMKAKGVRF